VKKYRWQFIFISSLIVLSAVIYFIHFLIFRDAHHIFIYLLGDIAFVPIEVLLVTIIIHRLLNMREKRAMLKKLNMVIGAFFSEVGLKLIEFFVQYDSKCEEIGELLTLSGEWDDRNFSEIRNVLEKHDFNVRPERKELVNLRKFLEEKKDFLLNLLENPNLLEHDSFTNLLWAVFHLTEELTYRVDISSTTEPDLNHLSGDVKRAYSLIILEWLDYMKHLKGDYPYLFSLAMRLNPFDKSAAVEVH
jgi:hypothetical protein